MEQQPVTKKMQEFVRRRNDVHADIARAARAVVPILKDHNLTNTATELSEKLFQLDAVEQEMANFVLEDPRAVIEALMKSFER